MAKIRKPNQVSREGAFIIAFLIICLIVLVMVISINITTSDKYFCEKNPEQCICEEWECIYTGEEGASLFVSAREMCQEIQLNDKQSSGNACSKQRKQTPEELEIDYCNKNPADSEQCICEGYKDSNIITGSHGENCRNISIKKCIVNGLYYHNEEIPFEGLYWEWAETCELESQFGNEVTDVRNFSMEIVEENITNCDMVPDYEKVCSKARPKTDQEKHPENYIAETQCVEYGMTSYETCWNETFEICYDGFKSKTEKCNDLRNETFESCVGGGCLNCTATCIRNSTTYRLKTECEKGNPAYIEASHKVWDSSTPEGREETICREKTEREERISSLMGNPCDILSLYIKRCESGECPAFWKGSGFFAARFPDKEGYASLREAYREKGCTT